MYTSLALLYPSHSAAHHHQPQHHHLTKHRSLLWPRGQLVRNILRVLPRQGDVLGMAAPRHELVLGVGEFDRGVCECLADCSNGTDD